MSKPRVFVITLFHHLDIIAVGRHEVINVSMRLSVLCVLCVCVCARDLCSECAIGSRATDCL